MIYTKNIKKERLENISPVIVHIMGRKAEYVNVILNNFVAMEKAPSLTFSSLKYGRSCSSSSACNDSSSWFIPATR